MVATQPSAELYGVLAQQHQALRELLDRIGAALAERRLTIVQVGDLLGELGDRLIKHFAMEETGGYLGDALNRAPQLVRRANDLLAQHPKMARRAQEIVSLGAARPSSQPWWDETEARFTAFMKELLAHERLEDRLVQEAFTEEIHAGD